MSEGGALVLGARRLLRLAPVVALAVGLLVSVGDGPAGGRTGGAPRAAGANPFIQQGPKLIGSGATGATFEGSSVAISSDGSTALVGGDGENGDTGAVWVFTHINRIWRQQAKLVANGATSMANQGTSVALSADGNTALVGAPGNRVNVGPRSVDRGAVWVFTRAKGTWRQQAKLVAVDAIGDAEEGFSVALSADGNEALIGGPGDNGKGAAWVFTRTSGVWVQRVKLVGSGATGDAGQGVRVALSSDGRTALIGGPFDNGSAGATWIFTRTGNNWSEQGPKLVGSDASGAAFQGVRVALSGDGSTALIGGSMDDGDAGAAWVFTRAKQVWSQQGPKLVGTGAAGSAQQGLGVALSGDGNTALIGGPYDDSRTGAAWEFTRTNGTWSQHGAKLVGTGVQAPDLREPGQGFSVSVSASGNMALIGDPNDGDGRGATWAFAQPQIVPPLNTFMVTRIRTSVAGTIRFSVKVPGAGSVDVLETAWKDNLASMSILLQPAPGRFVFARAHLPAAHAGTLRVSVTPDARGRFLVAHHAYRVTLRLWVSYTPTGGRYRSVGFVGLHLPTTPCKDADHDTDCD